MKYQKVVVAKFIKCDYPGIHWMDAECSICSEPPDKIVWHAWQDSPFCCKVVAPEPCFSEQQPMNIIGIPPWLWWYCPICGKKEKHPDQLAWEQQQRKDKSSE